MRDQSMVLIVILIIFVLIPIDRTVKPYSATSQEVSTPIVDGKWDEDSNTWSAGDQRSLTMVNGLQILVSMVFNESHLFIGAKFSDNDPTLGESGERDIFGVEFDINGDQVPMGMLGSLDDALFLGFEGNKSSDFILSGMGQPAVQDTENGGTEDTFGRIGIDIEGNFVFEVLKKLSSGDEKGSDISLSQNSTFSVMFAYWDNRYFRSESTTHSDWEQFVVQVSPDASPQLIDTGAILGMGAVLVLLVVSIGLRFGLSRRLDGINIR